MQELTQLQQKVQSPEQVTKEILEDIEDDKAATKLFASSITNNSEVAKILIKESYAAKNIKATIINIIGNLELVILKAQTIAASGQEGYEIRWYNVPLKDPAFTGREVQLQQLSNLLYHLATVHAQLPMAVCHGTGGVGKTHLAIEFIYQHLERYKTICWIPSHTGEVIKSAYAKLATGLGLESKDAAETTTLVRSWLSAHGPSLLIYDAAPNYEVLENYLPATGAHVLVTSRNSEWPTEGIKLNSFTSEQARTYLLNRLGPRSIASTEHLYQLAAIFDYMPLALGQASAFINKNRLSIQHYLSLYNQNKRALLINKTLPVNCYHVPLFENWDATLKTIQQISPLAMKLLNLSAYLAPSEIPFFLLKPFADSHESILSRKLFEEILMLLSKYSLIEIDVLNRCFSMSPLLQDMLLLKSTSIKKHSYWVLLFSLFKKGLHPENLKLVKYDPKKFVLPHLESYREKIVALSQKLTNEDQGMMVLSSYSCLAYYYHRQGDVKARDTMLKKCIALLEAHPISFRYSLLNDLYQQISKDELAENAVHTLSLTSYAEEVNNGISITKSEGITTRYIEMNEEEPAEEDSLKADTRLYPYNSTSRITDIPSAVPIEEIAPCPIGTVEVIEKSSLQTSFSCSSKTGAADYFSEENANTSSPPKVFIWDAYAGRDIKAFAFVEINKLKVVKSEDTLAKEKREYITRFWNIPSRNPNFTGREELLTELVKRIRQTSGKQVKPVVVTAYHGLGGVGKTQLAIEFIHRHYKEYEIVCWIPSENPEQIAGAYLELAQDLQLLPADQKTRPEKVVQLVKNWLIEHPKSLLIFDNASDYKSIETYLPQLDCDIVITSRYTQWLDKGIEVDVFTLSEAREYIQKLLKHREIDTIELIDTLAKELGCLPLALAQATAYIKQNRLSIEQYLDIYSQRKAYLLTKETLPPGDHHAAVYVTWDITMQVIAKESHFASTILNMCAYLYSERIPGYLLKMLAGQMEINPKAELFEEAFGILDSYSMLAINEANYTANIHRLVQDVIRDNLARTAKTEAYIISLLRILGQEFDFNKEDLIMSSKVRELVAHVERVCDYFIKFSNGHHGFTNESHKQGWKLLNQLGAFEFYTKGNAKLALTYYENCLEIAKRLGETSVYVAWNLSNIGAASYYLSRPEEVKVPLKRAKEAWRIYKQVYGEDRMHENIANSLNDIGLGYRGIGDYQMALFYFQHAWEMRKSLYGPDNPHAALADSLSNLGNTHYAMNKFKQALEYHKQALQIKTALYGDDKRHQDDMAFSLSNIGVAYYALALYSQAKRYLERTLEKREALYKGEDRYHPDMAKSLNNMGAVCYALGQLEKAKHYYQLSRNIYDRTRPEGHTDKARVLYNIALLLLKQSYIDQAIKEHEGALTMREAIYKDSLYPGVLESYQGLADTYELALSQEREPEFHHVYKEKMIYYKEKSEEYRKKLLTKNPETFIRKSMEATVAVSSNLGFQNFMKLNMKPSEDQIANAKITILSYISIMRRLGAAMTRVCQISKLAKKDPRKLPASIDDLANLAHEITSLAFPTIQKETMKQFGLKYFNNHGGFWRSAKVLNQAEPQLSIEQAAQLSEWKKQLEEREKIIKSDESNFRLQ